MIIFVHGVPETTAIWDDLRTHLHSDSVALSMPGFGCARPAGFSSTKDAYVDWLLEAIDEFDEPVDLVGHDWGAILTGRIATAYGDRVRSWTTDSLHFLHPEYVWHDFAKIWQTPGEGEAFWESQLAGSVEDSAALYELFGVPRAGAMAIANGIDATMASCILDLYRSATPNPHATWNEPLGPTLAPGLLVAASEDPFADEMRNLEMAAALGARVVPLRGLGHWWALQAPEQGAAVIEEFVASLA